MSKEQIETTGKTQMFCAMCNAIQRCAASKGKAGHLVDGNAHPSGRVFRRTRTCSVCETSFDTVEMAEENVQRLIKARTILQHSMAKLRGHIKLSQLIDDSNNSLTESLASYEELFPASSERGITAAERHAYYSYSPQKEFVIFTHYRAKALRSVRVAYPPKVRHEVAPQSIPVANVGATKLGFRVSPLFLGSQKGDAADAALFRFQKKYHMVVALNVRAHSKKQIWP